MRLRFSLTPKGIETYDKLHRAHITPKNRRLAAKATQHTSRIQQRLHALEMRKREGKVTGLAYMNAKNALLRMQHIHRTIVKKTMR
jgi:hypothetical protein